MQRRSSSSIPRFQQDLLVQNNPKLTQFDLWLRHAAWNDEVIAQALRQNDQVTELSLFLVDNETTWPQVCAALATRTVLTKVSLRCCGSRRNNNNNNRTTRRRSQLALLRAIGQNPHVEQVMVEEVQLTREALQLCLQMVTAGATVEFRPRMENSFPCKVSSTRGSRHIGGMRIHRQLHMVHR